jgi:hypothetical protein
MNRKHGLSCLLLFTTLFWTGCATTPVKIISPLDHCSAQSAGSICPMQNPVTQIKLSLDSNFDPTSSLVVWIDSNSPLTGFAPAPVPNGATMLNIAGPFTGRGNSCGGCSTEWASHTLNVSATCGFFCTDKTVSVTFIPPQIFFNTQGPAQSSMSPSLSVPTEMYVSLPLTPTTGPVSVQIYEISNPGPPPPTPPNLSSYLLSLGTSPNAMQPPGKPITVTIPNSGNGHAAFWVQGSSAVGTPIAIAGAALGCQVGAAPGGIVK